MSGSSTTVGAVNVVMTGDAVPLEQAITKTVAKLATVEQRSASTAAAVAAVSNRVDELRDKQALLTRVLDEAANATQRDQAKVNALRNELEQTTAALTRLTTAQNVSAAVQQKVHTAQVAATGASRNLGGAVLEASRAFEDMQYGIAGVLNNIPSLVMQLGGTMGLAGVISLVLVFATQLTKHWPEFGSAAETAIDGATSKTSELRSEIAELDRELRSLQTGISTTRLGAAEDLKAAMDEASAKIASSIPGGRVRFDLLMELTKGDSSLLPGYGGYTAANRDQFVSTDAFEAAKKAAADLDEAAEKYGKVLAKEAEEKAQRDSDNAVEQANRDEAAYQNRAKADSKAAERELTPMQEYDAVKAIFADIKQNQAGGRSTASWANPTVSADRAVELSGVAETMVIHADATQAELDALNASFGVFDSEVIDTRTNLEKFSDELSAVDWGALGTDAAATAAAGNLGGAGAMLGSAAGTVVGNMVAPGIGGAIGGGLGSAVGGMMGDMLNELIESLGVLTPLFDALATIIAALAPIFMVIEVLMDAIGNLLIAVVPIIAALAEPIAALLLVVVRIVEALLPFINIVLLGVGVLIAFLEVITMGVQWIDTNFFRPLSSAAAWLYNGFVDVYNAFIDFIRTIPGFGEFGVKMQSISTTIEDTIGDFAKDLGDIGAVMGETAAETKEVGRSMSNIPSWYRVPLAEYRAAGGPSGGAAGGSVMNVGTIIIQSAADTLKETLRREQMRRRGTPVPDRGRDEAN